MRYQTEQLNFVRILRMGVSKIGPAFFEIHNKLMENVYSQQGNT